MHKMKEILFFVFTVIMNISQAQISNVWVADNGDGTYKNPILYADYSDPDVCRVGDNFYMTSSSFEAIPGLPILHSKDLVNWKLIGHALQQLVPLDVFNKPQHGKGVWAPAIRFHKGEFYIYYPDPDYGIFVTKATNPAGPWSEPLLVEGGKGLIDPCPLWDEGGQVYLVHAFAGSRAGIKSVLVIKKMNATGTKTIDKGVLVYDGHETDPTVEGPKLYKRNGYYYIFAPAGGVSTGWQIALRSKNIYGPYERKIIMEQGSTTVNGPHQGAWVTTPAGEDWFLHFQDKEAYGRVVHLQPVKWVNDWPVIGLDKNKTGTGEPVLNYRKPVLARSAGTSGTVKNLPVITPAESDEFNNAKTGLQWQWMANPQPYFQFGYPSKGLLRLYAVNISEKENLWDAPNVLLQKFPAEEFMATTKFTFHPNQKLINEKAGLAIMGLSYANIAVKQTHEGLKIIFTECIDAKNGKKENEWLVAGIAEPTVYLRVKVSKGASCHFSYSVDGHTFLDAGKAFQALPGQWIGAKVGLFCTGEMPTNDAGYADVDWFRIEKNQ